MKYNEIKMVDIHLRSQLTNSTTFLFVWYSGDPIYRCWLTPLLVLNWLKLVEKGPSMKHEGLVNDRDRGFEDIIALI